VTTTQGKKLTLQPIIGNQQGILNIGNNPTLPTGFNLVDLQTGGLKSVKATTLTPKIPNITGGAKIEQNKPVQMMNTIQMPKFNTKITPVNTGIKRPVPLPDNTQGYRTTPAPGTTEAILAVLGEIDPELLISERVGKKKKGYRLEVLQGFANRLGLTVSGKKKDELINDINNIRREMGF
jgi:hypothetical protein